MTGPAPGKPTPAEAYQAVFAPAVFETLARVVVDLADPQPGERVLDLACGTGAVARTVAPIVGADGSVVGVDLRPGMLEVARSLPVPPGAPIEWREGDATALDLPDSSFDLTICQQGLQFFEDARAATGEVFRVSVAGGRYVVAVWEWIDRQPLFRDMADVEARHLADLGVTYEDTILPFSWRDPDELRAILEGAGFEAVELSNTSVVADFAADTFVADLEYAYSALLPAFVEDPARFEGFVERVTEETRDLVDAYRDGDRVRFEMPTHLAVARRPP